MKEQSTDYVQLSVRLPEEMHMAIATEARRQRRSFNAQLLMYLDEVILTEESFEGTQLDISALSRSELANKVR